MPGWRPDGVPTAANPPLNRDLKKAWGSYRVVGKYLKQCPVKFVPSTDPRGFRLLLGQPQWDAGARDFFEAMIVEANRLFTGLIVSDWCDRLCKCRYRPCARYFFSPKPILRTRKAGLFCSARCRRLALATTATDQKRRRCHAALIEYAAQQLRKQKVKSEWNEDTKTKTWLANKITHYLQVECKNRELKAYRHIVKVNWVTLNWVTIEQARSDLTNGHPK
jgi:hypothetical protein